MIRIQLQTFNYKLLTFNYKLLTFNYKLLTNFYHPKALALESQ